MKRRKQKKTRAFFISFALVLSVLVGGSLLLLYSVSQPTINHLPGSLPKYSPHWSSYAPSSVLQFTFRNYSAVRALNSSAYVGGTLLTTLSPAYSLPMHSVRSLISVLFSTPNASVDIALVDPTEFGTFSTLAQTKGPVPVVEGDATLYFTQIVGSSGFVSGWLFALPSDNAIGFAEGTTDARTVIDTVLNVRDGGAPSIFSRTDVTQMFYVAGGADNHLAFTVQNFPGLVSTGQMTLQVLDESQSEARTSYIVKFGGSDTALSQFDFVKKEYLTSQYFAIYDQYVLAQKYQSLSQLVGAVQAVG